MRRVALLLVALAAAGCGAETTSKPLPPALPAPAPVTPSMSAAGADPQGDSTDPAADIVRADLSQDQGELIVRITVASPPLESKGRVDIGAYLLANENDDNPAALKASVGGTAPPTFTLGPWLEDGTPVTGSVSGTTVEIRGGKVEQGKWRFVQFYAESDAGDDVLPDVSDQADDMLPIAGS